MSDSTNRRVAVVTGANAGVGKHTSLGFARLGFHVILCSRSEARGEAAAEWIRSCCPDASAEVVPLDLQDFHSVLRCADMIIAKACGVIHALVLNAGIGGLGSLPDWSKPTAKGVNMIFQVNFVAQFLLLRRLEHALKAAKGGRVVCLSSVAHRFSTWQPALASWRPSPPGSSYSASKLAMAILAAELSRRWSADGVSGVSANPGAVNSEIWYRGQLPRWCEAVIRPIFRLLFLTSEQGSATSVAAATDPRFAAPTSTPTYLSPYYSFSYLPILGDLLGPFAGPRPCQPVPIVADPEAGRLLWEDTSDFLQGYLGSESISESGKAKQPHHEPHAQS